MSDKPYYTSCENNRAPILKVIKPILENKQIILEIGSGTGQHAVYFAAHMPNIIWQTSDLVENHAGINLWLEDSDLPNVRAPISLDVNEHNWNLATYDAVFTANTLHIMAQQTSIKFLQMVSHTLPDKGLFIAYGPFNYKGAYTSQSNQDFDQWLMLQNHQSAIRNFEEINEAANMGGMRLFKDISMPANNRVLVWQKSQQITQST